MEISLAAEKLFSLGPVEVTNSLLSAFIIVLVLSVIAIRAGSKVSIDNPGKFQLFLEWVVGGFKGIAGDILGETRARALFSFLFTFFVFIVFSNWFGLLPIVGPIVTLHHEEHAEESSLTEVNGEEYDEVAEEKRTEEEVDHSEEPSVGHCIKKRDCILTKDGIQVAEAFPVFRAPTSDVSNTLALALISVITIHGLGLSTLGIGYIKKFFNFSDPIAAFVGILELISEIGKIISFTFRLFGNIFAGEVLLLVVTSISFGLATLPFLALEVFVGFIQAFVFFMLTVVFISLAVTPHGHD